MTDDEWVFIFIRINGILFYHKNTLSQGDMS